MTSSSAKRDSWQPVPSFALDEFEAVNPAFARKGRWNEVLKGRVEGLHMRHLPLTRMTTGNLSCVDFREIYSLPMDYLTAHATRLGLRSRLLSPFLEHFSQAFARFFYASRASHRPYRNSNEARTRSYRKEPDPTRNAGGGSVSVSSNRRLTSRTGQFRDYEVMAYTSCPCSRSRLILASGS